MLALGRALAVVGRYDEALGELVDRSALLQTLPELDLGGEGVTLHDIADVRRAQGDLDAALISTFGSSISNTVRTLTRLVWRRRLRRGRAQSEPLRIPNSLARRRTRPQIFSAMSDGAFMCRLLGSMASFIGRRDRGHGKAYRRCCRFLGRSNLAPLHSSSESASRRSTRLRASWSERRPSAGGQPGARGIARPRAGGPANCWSSQLQHPPGTGCCGPASRHRQAKPGPLRSPSLFKRDHTVELSCAIVTARELLGDKGIEAASETLGKAIEAVDRMETDPERMATAASMLARLMKASGHAELAVADGALARTCFAVPRNRSRREQLVMAMHHVQLGDLDAAASLLTTVGEAIREDRSGAAAVFRAQIGLGWHALGAYLEREGSEGDAIAAYRRSAGMVEGIDRPSHLARPPMTLPDLLRTCGDLAAAEDLQRATAHRLPADRDVTRRTRHRDASARPHSDPARRRCWRLDSVGASVGRVPVGTDAGHAGRGHHDDPCKPRPVRRHHLGRGTAELEPVGHRAARAPPL